VTINSFPTLTRERVATFRWNSNEELTYKCAIDDPKVLINCGSGQTWTWRTPQLSDGEHTFYLVAVDSVGNKVSLEKTFIVGE
jgi:hypothetical protein